MPLSDRQIVALVSGICDTAAEQIDWRTDTEMSDEDYERFRAEFQAAVEPIIRKQLTRSNSNE